MNLRKTLVPAYRLLGIITATVVLTVITFGVGTLGNPWVGIPFVLITVFLLSVMEHLADGGWR